MDKRSICSEGCGWKSCVQGKAHIKTDVRGGLESGRQSEAELPAVARASILPFAPMTKIIKEVREKYSTDKETLGCQEIVPRQALALQTNTQNYLEIYPHHLVLCVCKNKRRGHGRLPQSPIYWA